jgi:uncharacterized membrane protein YfcA
MIDISIFEYFIVLIFIFLAGLMDSIAGGGGLISLPAYLFAGLPPHLALGTNKFSSCWGTLFATQRYFRKNMIDLPIALTAAFSALLGSWFGTKTVLLIKPFFLNYILIVLIPVITLITLMNRNAGIVNNSSSIVGKRKYFIGLMAGLIIGYYDGFFGPGTGTFLILVFTFMLKYDYVTANGNTKVVNLASNIAAVITFAVAGKIYFALAIPAAIFGILGNLAGSRLVILKGNKVIQRIFFLVMFLLMIKIIWNLFRG